MSKSPQIRSRKKTAYWTLIFAYGQIAYAFASGILLVPLYLKHIPIELYGAWLATGNVLSWLVLLDPGLSTIIMQRVGRAYGENNKVLISAYTCAGIAVSAIISILILSVGWFVSGNLGWFVELSNSVLQSDLNSAFKVSVIASALMIMAFACNAVNKGLLESVGPGIFNLASSIASLFLTWWLIHHGFGLLSIPLGLLARSLSIIIASVFLLIFSFKRESIHFRLDFGRIREITGLLSFTSLGRLGTVLAKNSDALLIARFVSVDAVPLYSLTKRGFAIAELILVRPSNAISAGLAHLSGQDRIERIHEVIAMLLRFNAWMLGLAAFGFLAFNDDFVALWVGDKFFAGYVVSAVLCVAFYCQVLVTNLNSLCVALGEIKQSAIASFLYAVVMLLALVLGTYNWGILGAALSPILGTILIYLWYYPHFLFVKVGLDKRTGKRMLLNFHIALVAGFGAYYLVNFTRPTSWISFSFCIIGYTVSYGVLLTLLSSAFRSDVLQLRSVMSRKFLMRKAKV